MGAWRPITSGKNNKCVNHLKGKLTKGKLRLKQVSFKNWHIFDRSVPV
jgi:hypothetical protein